MHNILFVDDEVNILNAIKRLLRKEDYNIVVSTSGEEALSVLEQRDNMHMIISDYRMSGINGIELLQKAKEMRPHAIRVILSGYADASVVLDAINKGEVYRFLTKPWNDDEFKIDIRQCLNQRDLLEENRDLMEKLSRQNEDLEMMVQERTQSLSLSQQILMRLPIPIIGVSNEGIVAMVNRAVKDRYPSLSSVLLGEDVLMAFPAGIGKLVKESLRTNNTEEKQCLIDGQTVRMRILPLGDAPLSRGQILILEEAQCLKNRSKK